MTGFERGAAAALRQIARNQQVKSYIGENPPLRRALSKAVGRFLGGDNLGECVATVEALNREGFATTIDFMGENSRGGDIAQQAKDEFLQAARAVAAHRLEASISLDLSHIGLAQSSSLALRNVSAVAEAALAAGIELMISAEGSERTDAVLETHRALCQDFDNVGITLQAALHRSVQDLDQALAVPGKIRLVKGAFAEPATLAWPRGEELDRAYEKLMFKLLRSGHRCSIGTHDPLLLDAAMDFTENTHPDSSQVEFELLLGVTPERLALIRDRGHRTRIFVPYGREWFLYACHRLAENPSGVLQSIVDGVEAISEQA